MTSNTGPAGFTPGYPVDQRRPERVARLQQSYFGDFEANVSRVVARLTGARVVLQDDGRQDAMVDMRIEYSDGRVGWLEVWTDTDEKDAAMRLNLYRSQRRLPCEWPVPELSAVWFVTLSRGSELRGLEAELLPVLRTMEATGETFPGAPTRTELLAAENLNVGHLLSLGVVAVHSRPAGMNEIAAIKLYPQGIAGPSEPSWSPFLRWVADTLASPRLETHRAKLARMDSGERHFVLGVMPSTSGDVYFALTRHPGVPAEPPELVGGVTHLWVMDWWAERCVAWFPDGGWLDARRNWVTA